MKKLLVILSLSLLLVCFFALGVSADTTTSIHAGVDKNQSVTLSDGTVCNLFDAYGNALIWFITGTEEVTLEDGTTKTQNVYASIRADIGITGDNKVDYNCGWAATGGGDKLDGIMQYQVGTLTITYNGTTYNANTIVVANLMDDDVKLTSGQNVGNPVTSFAKTFYCSTNIQYFYGRLDTISFNSEVFKNCTNLKYANIMELTELRQIGSQTFNTCSSLFANQALDLSRTKLKTTSSGSFGSMNVTEYIFPETFYQIGEWAFQTNKQLTKITFKGKITSFNPNSTFKDCEKLEAVIGDFSVFTSGKYTEFKSYTFYNCYKLANFSGLIENGIMTMPSSLSYIENYTFQNCDSIKAIKFTGSKVKILQQSFHSLNSLEYLYFPRSSKLELPSCEVFSNNEKLKAVALPDDCTLIPDRGFKNCTSLKAVYLPANLYELRTNGWDQAPFTSNPELYFVNDWFSVLDESGNFLFDKFVMPERPEVYYFPSTLTVLFDRAAGGTGFLNCYKINPVLVFPTSVQQIIINDGVLINCGTKGETKTAVFLGDMTKVCHSSQDSRLNNIQYVFANANDKSTADVEIVNNNTNRPADTAIIFFCASNTSYKMIASNGTYGSSLGGAHFESPKATKVIQEANCVLPELSTKYCFCGKDIETTQTADALGHDFNEIPSLIVYENGNFFVNGTATHSCLRENCNECEEKIASPIFIAKGFSKTQANVLGTALMQVFDVNTVALKSYVSYGEYEIASYGLIAVATIGASDDVIDSNGNYSNLVNGETKGSYTIFGDTNYAEMTARVKNIGTNTAKLIYTNLCVVLKDRETGAFDATYASMNGESVSVSDKLNSATSYEKIPNTVTE